MLKALLPVSMKYTARDESLVVNITPGEAECYICHETHIKSCILLYKRSGGVLSVLLYFKCFIVFYTYYIYKVLSKCSSLII